MYKPQYIKAFLFIIYLNCTSQRSISREKWGSDRSWWLLPGIYFRGVGTQKVKEESSSGQSSRRKYVRVLVVCLYNHAGLWAAKAGIEELVNKLGGICLLIILILFTASWQRAWIELLQYSRGVFNLQCSSSISGLLNFEYRTKYRKLRLQFPDFSLSVASNILSLNLALAGITAFKNVPHWNRPLLKMQVHRRYTK